MPGVVRVGDSSDHGGTVITGASISFANGIPIARVGDLHECPQQGHGTTEIITGSPTVNVEGQPVARIGDVAGCGAVITGGSPDVNAG